MRCRPVHGCIAAMESSTVMLRAMGIPNKTTSESSASRCPWRFLQAVGHLLDEPRSKASRCRSSTFSPILITPFLKCKGLATTEQD